MRVPSTLLQVTNKIYSDLLQGDIATCHHSIAIAAERERESAMEGERGATPPPELVQVLEASSEFASYPGLQNDASVKEFLDRFPLQVLLGALQSEVYVPGLEDSVVSCLDKIFGTKDGALFIPNLMVWNLVLNTKALISDL